MDVRDVVVSYLMSPLTKITNPGISIQFKLANNSTSNRVNDLKIHNSKTFILKNIILTFRDTCKVFELKGDLLEMILNKKFNVDLASLADKKLMYDFEK